jgi:T5orf172 domain
VRDAKEVDAAEASLIEGMLPLGFERDPAYPSLLILICRKPRTKSLGMRSHFVFDLENLGHACELLLISRRRNISVDVIKETIDEWDDIKSIHMGTLNISIGCELAELITGIATEALEKALPSDREPIYDNHWGIQSLREALQRNPGYIVDSCSPARHLLVTQFHGNRVGITLETDPPVSMASFSTRCTPQKRPSRAGGSLTARSLSSFRENGFIYILRNPAFPEMLKIGYSNLLPEDRAQELSGTALPFQFDVLYRTASSCVYEVEKAVHRLLVAHRVSPNREYFRISLEAAIEAIRYCQGELTGINAWEPVPTVHRLRAGDRVTLPLKANQMFVLTAYRQPLDSSAEVLDIWQAHADGDLLEIQVTDDPGHVSGFSDEDPGGYEDPVPFLNRDNSAPNGMLIGRERLMAGDRLIWLSDEEGTTHCRSVVFEANSFCQVTCRTWNPQQNSVGLPLLLNYVTGENSKSMVSAVREVLTLGIPRTWAPRNPDAEDGWAKPATHPQPPEYWLPQLRRRRSHR